MEYYKEIMNDNIRWSSLNIDMNDAVNLCDYELI